MKPDLLVDWESYYSKDVSIQESCFSNYAAKSYGYLIGLYTDDFEWNGTPEELRADPKAMEVLHSPAYNLWAVNSNFDQQWTEDKRYFPEMKGRRWQCVSDYAVSHQLPRSLAGMHKALFGEEVDKSVRGQMKGVHWQELMCFEQDHWKGYNRDDNRIAEKCLRGLRERGPMSYGETAAAAHTRMICRRGIPVDLAFVDKARQALEWVRHNSYNEIPWRQTDKIMSAQAFNTYCCREGVAPPSNLRKNDDDFTEWKQLNPKMAWLMKARQNWELSNRKLSHIEKLLQRTDDNGTYFPDLLYCGAPHTRRWSSKGSSDGNQSGGDDLHSAFNLQNMDRSPLLGDVLPEFISPLVTPSKKTGLPPPGVFFRNFLVPPPGKVFLILDFSQVEPRTLYWMAGCHNLLDAIRSGHSVYDAFAIATNQWAANQGKIKDCGDVAYYTLIKNQTIGWGFGMGGPKFSRYARIEEQKAIDAIALCRRELPEVPQLWNLMQDLIWQSSRSEDPLEVLMPNGEVMYRFNVERYEKEFADGTKKWAFQGQKILGDDTPRTSLTDMYGAKLVENVVQRCARDLLAEAVVRLELAGLPVYFHAHDEVIIAVDRDNAKDALAHAIELTKQVPAWAAGLPIGCSGGIYERYTKD